MGTKKLKKKKLKCKKILKLQKNKKPFLNKNFSLNNPKYFSNSSPENQSQDGKKYSRFLSEKYLSKIKLFSQVREQYFGYLQAVVYDNCKCSNSVVSEDILESLSLELEQSALLACLQIDIYEKLITKIISDIEKCTEENQMHQELKRLLPDSNQGEELISLKTEKTNTNAPETETYFQIPTVTSTREENYSSFSTPMWEHHSGYNSEIYDSQSLINYPENYCNDHSEINIQPELIQTPVYWNNQVLSNTNISEPSVMPHLPNPPCPKSINKTPPHENETLLESRNQLLKSVEQNLKEVEKVNKQKKDEKERAYIAQILEGDDSADDKFYDSLSDNDNESKENLDESNLMDRLDKMREIFGLEGEESPVPVVQENHKVKVHQLNHKPKRPTMWKYEKIIQLHKFSLLSSEMTFNWKLHNQMRFLDLFGEDSDEEHELEYLSEEKFRTSCTERISSWVVKHLMPFYHDKRIIGRSVFKSLGHYISDTIVDKIQYPDEWTVKYFVSKFFPPRKKYICEADIFAFQPD